MGWRELGTGGARFLVILVPSSCASSATVSALRENNLALRGNNLGGLASLWLSVTLSGASAARPGMWVRGQVSGFAFKVYQCTGAGMTLPLKAELKAY